MIYYLYMIFKKFSFFLIILFAILLVLLYITFNYYFTYKNKDPLLNLTFSNYQESQILDEIKIDDVGNNIVYNVYSNIINAFPNIDDITLEGNLIFNSNTENNNNFSSHAIDLKYNAFTSLESENQELEKYSLFNGKSNLYGLPIFEIKNNKLRFIFDYSIKENIVTDIVTDIDLKYKIITPPFFVSDNMVVFSNFSYENESSTIYLIKIDKNFEHDIEELNGIFPEKHPILENTIVFLRNTDIFSYNLITKKTNKLTSIYFSHDKNINTEKYGWTRKYPDSVFKWKAGNLNSFSISSDGKYISITMPTIKRLIIFEVEDWSVENFNAKIKQNILLTGFSTVFSPDGKNIAIKNKAYTGFLNNKSVDYISVINIESGHLIDIFDVSNFNKTNFLLADWYLINNL